MILGQGEWITPADLPRPLKGDGASPASTGEDLREAMRVYEKAHIQSVMQKTNNDKKQSAELLGVSLSSLYRKIEELEIS